MASEHVSYRQAKELNQLLDMIEVNYGSLVGDISKTDFTLDEDGEWLFDGVDWFVWLKAQVKV